jgi:hypothetical protein
MKYRDGIRVKVYLFCPQCADDRPCHRLTGGFCCL